ncbi:TPA: minor capsid protein [Streptococcus suis]|nr:minor capsid protein [Streptococcus suis]
MRMSDKRIKNNQRYNAERKAQAELMKRDLDRDRMLAQIYQESFDRMQREIDGFYMRYASKEGLTKQEAMKRVSEMDVTKFNAKAAKAVKEKDFSHATNEWLKVYNLKMKVSRLELLRAELTLEIQNLTAEVNEVFDKARIDEYLNEYKRQAGILGISSSGAKKRMQAILDADFYGQKFSARVWGGLGLRATLQREVFGSLNRIFTDMMGYKQEMKRLAKKYGTSEQIAKRLLKTEIARINADTQYSMLKDNGFTHMIFVAEPGACDLCGPLDKVAVPIDKVEKGVNFYPMHPNCRCSAYGHIKMDYKAGGSTLDEYELWDGEKGNEDESLDQTLDNSTKLLELSKNKVYNQNMETSQSIAQNMLDEIAKTEPQITETLKSIAKASNGHLEGLDFRLKSKDSLIRKIETDALLEDISIQEAAKQIKDVLRYTTILEPDDFGKNYDEMKTKLIKSGFEIKKVKNTWSDSGPYKGVNTILEKDGIAFEMQYHTQESFELKNGKLHELYEERRLPATSQERKLELDKEMVQLSKNLTVPNGIEGVK